MKTQTQIIGRLVSAVQEIRPSLSHRFPGSETFGPENRAWNAALDELDKATMEAAMDCGAKNEPEERQ